MSNIRHAIEFRFERLARWLYRRRLSVALAISVFILPCILILVASVKPIEALSWLPKLELDTSTEGFFHEDDPVLLTYNDFRRQFGREELVIIAIEHDNIFSFDFLSTLRSLHHDLEQGVPHLDEVNSLINARNTRGEENALIVEDLLEDWPENRRELALIKDRALANPIYENFILSEDGRFTTVTVRSRSYSDTGGDEDVLAGFDAPADAKAVERPANRSFLTDQENSEVVNAVISILKPYQEKGLQAYVAGSPVVVNDLKRSMQRDMQTFTRFALLTIAVCLFLLFRRISGVILPLVVVILTLIATLASMAAAGVAFKLPTQILPSFLLAVGIGASVHILAVFYRRLHEVQVKEEAIAYALGHSGLAVVMASLTTAAGLFSFSMADVAPVADMGRFAALGVIYSLLFTILLLPVLLAWIPVKYKAHEGSRHHGMDRVLRAIADFATVHAKGVIITSSIIVVVSVAGLFSLRFYHNPLIWFPEDHAVRLATQKIDQELKGSTSIEAVLNTKEVDGAKSVEFLNTLDQVDDPVKQITINKLSIDKTLTLTDIVKEIHQALNEGNPAYYRIPRQRDVVVQELLLFENTGTDDLEDIVDTQFQKVRYTLKSPWMDAGTGAGLLEEVQTRLESVFHEAEVTLTGTMALFSRILTATMYSTAESYVIAAVVISIMMILLIGNFSIGLVAMIPNLGPIIITLGIMGWVGIPLDMFTMLIGSIAIGLAVDDTIHFMHNFRRYFHDYGDVRRAVQMTLHTTGRAMLVTTLVLSIGFFMFTFASMNNVFYFGLLVGCTIIMALVADFLLAPALMMVVAKSAKLKTKLETDEV